MNTPIARLAGAALLFAAAPALAADEVLEEVVVVAKRRTPVRYAPATVSALDQQLIERTLSADIRDLVRYEPGVSVRNDPVRFGLDSFAIRGVGGDRVAAEVDGVSVAEGFSVGALADSGRVYTDLAFVQRVEILRGPASALYGSDAIGGVVRFQTIDPDDLLRGSRALASQVRGGYRGETGGWSASTLNAGAAGAAQWLFGYVHRDDHEADIVGELEPNPRRSRSDQALAKLVLPRVASGPMEIALEGGRARDETIVNALLGIPPRFTNTTAMSGDDSAEHVRFALEHTLAPRNALMDEAVWRVTAQYTTTEQITDEQRRAVPPRTPPVQLQRTFLLEDRLAGAEATASKTLAAGEWSHQLVYGVEIDVGRVTEERDGFERNLETGAVSPVILGERFPVRDFPITERLEAGAYVQDEITLPARRWRVTPGLRFDLYDLRAREDEMYLEDNPSARPVDLDENALTPKLAVAYEASDAVTAYAQYARGFRSPPYEDVNIGLEIPLFNYRALPNPELKPETSDGVELGLRFRSSAWRGSLSAHYTEFRDFIESRVNLGRDPVSGVTLFQSRNAERARVFGFELAGQLDAGAFAPSLEGWSVTFNAAWARGDNTVTDQPLNAIEPLTGTLTLVYDARSGWGASLAAAATASKDRLDETTTPLYRTEAYLRVDAYAWFEVGERTLVNIGVANLTNERCLDWIDVRGRAADDPLVPYAAQAGRNASVSVAWRF